MARQVIVNLTDTINSWRQKTNLIGEQGGDLDELTTGSGQTGSPGFTGHDSSYVSAMNHLHDMAWIDSNQLKEYHIDTHAISGRNIDSDVITSHHLAVSGMGGYSLLGGGVQYQFLRSDGDGTFTWAIPPTTNYAAGLGISKSTIDDSSGVFNVAGGHGLTQEADGLMLEDMPANTVKVRDANTAGASSNKAVVNEQILIGDGTGFTSAALSQDVLMTNAGVVTIQPDVVTNAKLNDMAANTVKVNATAGAENPTDLALDSNTLLARVGTANIDDLSISTNSVVARAAGDLVSFAVPVNTVVGRVAGDVVAAQVATGQIADNAVTTDKILDGNVTNAKLSNMAASTIKVRNAATAGVPSDVAVGDAQILIGNGSGFTAATLSGDATITNAGVVTLASGDVTLATNADNINVDEKNDDVNYQILFSDNNGAGYQRPYIDTDNDHLLYNPSSHTLTAGTFAGNATSANYADLAEKYTTSEEHPVGTVMMISSNETEETVVCTANGIPMGVVSADPAYLMNADIDGQALALKGRVPVRIVGAVNKGDPVYAHHNGCAGKEFNGFAPDGSHAEIIGIALESSTAVEEKLIECVLKV